MSGNKNNTGKEMPSTNSVDLEGFFENQDTRPFLIVGDSLSELKKIPNNSVDMCMTSPPYWGQRQYEVLGIGLEKNFEDYVGSLVNVFNEIHRILKPTGSLWLNMGDAYINKSLLGMPWRVAIALIDTQKWTLRNDVIWNKVKGAPDNSKDKLRNIHEHIFHFVKDKSNYYYNVDAIRNTPKKSTIKNGAIVSATGVTGVRYKRQIELSEDLSLEEKNAANIALNKMLKDVADGKFADFRMVIRGSQRTTHSNSTKISGRAKELVDKGFYFLKYHPDGAKPSDVWDILPEDTQKREKHFAAYPQDLCRIPIAATCPPNGIVIDPFCGTGTTLLVAMLNDRKSIGIDIVPNYITIAQQRIMENIQTCLK